VWLANPNSGAGMGWDVAYGNIASSKEETRAPMAMARIRSKSEAELALLKDRADDTPPTPIHGTSLSPSAPSSPSKHTHAQYSLHPPALPSRRHSTNRDTIGAEERWMYKGRAELVDLEIIVSPGVGINSEGCGGGRESRLEVLSPEGSFVVYAGEFMFLHRLSHFWFPDVGCLRLKYLGWSGLGFPLSFFGVLRDFSYDLP
jgi:FYVE, RhoGEF and PH domain containing 5/6